MAAMQPEDAQFMRYALRLAARTQGRSGDNPAVGCVLARAGQVVGTGWTAHGGRPHAETQALESAGAAARGATAYVTLEPCAHYGHTPPCALALREAGVARVVIGCTDPDPRTSGRGIALLEEAGITVTSGVLEDTARAHHAGFLRRLRDGLPEMSVKIATSADERITTGDTSSRWVTGEEARRYGHWLRATHQAIVTGIGTVLSDDPLLTCRLDGLEDASPLRVVLDRQLRLPLTSALVQSAGDAPLWVLTSETTQCDAAQALRDAGAQVIGLPPALPGGETGDAAAFVDAMRLLASKGIHRALIEGGARLSTAALASGQASHLYWFRAPHSIGEAGLPALEDGQSLESTARLGVLEASRPLGQDWLYHYRLPVV